MPATKPSSANSSAAGRPVWCIWYASTAGAPMTTTNGQRVTWSGLVMPKDRIGPSRAIEPPSPTRKTHRWISVNPTRYLSDIRVGRSRATRRHASMAVFSNPSDEATEPASMEE